MAKCKICGKEARFEFLTLKGKIWLCDKHYDAAEKKEGVKGLLKDYTEITQ